MPEFETLLYDERDGVAYVTLNRPDADNSFNILMRQELKDLWIGMRSNDDVRVAVLTGSGDRAFCTGIDRHEAMGENYRRDIKVPGFVGHLKDNVMFNDPGTSILPKANDMWKPVVAAINGMACGGALYLLGEVDIIIAADHATFFDPHVSYGMVCAYESTHLLQKLPLGETLRLALLGAYERMSARRACELGLVSEVVPLEGLLDAATWAAEAIATVQPGIAQATVQAIWTAHDLARRDALVLAHTFVGLATQKQKILEGQDKFVSGERIQWRLR